ncbi:alpha/beta fold hydrolase [Streptomyces hyaluromycini]|uniref:Alpha/beta fold hydrolase n=1 Tax=Streptomyces hyaluromycini TaxID=1377993 RepID=A0ABV1XBG0_9ACTN
MSDLYYDVTGSGPVLLVLPGGAGHPMGLGPFTEHLAPHFTVVTYDPLGLAHGRLGDPVADQAVRDWSEGAHRALEEVLAQGEGEPAYVFGTSAGGITALDLLARHPDRLRHVIAHEPPCVTLLPDGERLRTELIEQLDAARPAPGTPMAVFLDHVLRPFTTYRPPAALPRLTIAAGVDSKGQLLYRTAEFVAEHTGATFTEFPGGHLGVLEDPAGFADRVRQSLLGTG